jgi:hypothetical protein
MCDKYQGASNYPTWVIALWIDNDQSAYRGWRTEAARYIKMFNEYRRHYPHEYDFEFFRRTPRTDAIHHLQDALRNGHDEYIEAVLSPPLPPAGPINDLIAWALNQVDWRDIATTIVDEVLAEPQEWGAEDEEQEDMQEAEEAG